LGRPAASRGPVVDAYRGLPGDAPSREDVLDHAGSAASEVRDDQLLRREQLQVRQRKGGGDISCFPTPADISCRRTRAPRRRPTISKTRFASALPVERSDSRWCCSSQRRATRSTIHRWLGRAPTRSRRWGRSPSLRWCRTARRPNARSCSCPRSCLTDPMIQFRNKTYPVSYERRHQSPAMVE
jgi:hypothetical protein